LLGNYAGRQVEGYSVVAYEGPNSVSKSITDYQVQWNTILQGQYYRKNGADVLGNPTIWGGDDDTALEFLYAHALQNKSTLSVAERTSLWTNNLSSSGLYIANRQAWYQMNTYGKTAAESGSVRYNMQAGWAIDSQITTETLGALAVGMRQQAANLAGDFGGITNAGYSLHAAQFYAAMYADAPFSSDVETLVGRGLAVVPIGSWTREIVTKAQELHTAGNTWLDSRNAIIAFVHQRGRDRVWVESASNTGLTTLAILYGQGNFIDTVDYGVRGGEDSDCNPATAGGLVGMMKGQSGVLAELTAAGFTVSLPQNYNDSSTVIGLPKGVWTTSEVLDVFQAAVETQITAGGGSIYVDPQDRHMYSIPDDSVITGDVSDPIAPGGLVGEVLARGGRVDVVVTRNGVVIADNPSNDRTDQGHLIDGVIDLSNNGVLPFSTYDGRTDSREDGYELHFDRNIAFEKLILHEGDIIDSNINGDPNVHEPYGGYFKEGELLTVEVDQNGVWAPVANLVLSEALADIEFFQTIELTFDRIEGQGIRVLGSAGGQKPFTTMTELEAFGEICLTAQDLATMGDTNEDCIINEMDFDNLLAQFGGALGDKNADFNGDGWVDLEDYVILRENFGVGINIGSAPESEFSATTPEPASMLLLALGGLVVLRRPR
ncbi:MAG: hypothetical protein HN350_21960, partial [Phycisphaerales bacterium]|nr:hypothetical protein [Phycisphaerales bacterium]